MKLSDLLHYYERLHETDMAGLTHSCVERISSSTIQNLECVSDLIQAHQASKFFAANMHQLQQDTAGLIDQFARLNQTVSNLKQYVKFSMDSMRHYAAAQSEKRFVPNSLYMLSPDRSLKLEPDIQAQIQSRIATLCSWQYPAAIVRPGHDNFVHYMTGSDPLYLVDLNCDILQPALAGFNEVFRRRVLCHAVNEKDQTMLAKLPANQMGLCLLWGFFNFRSQSLVLRWLTELYEITRPGGTVMFTYNDCDTAHGVSLWESGWMSFVSGQQIRDHATGLGFAIAKDQRCGSDVWLMELIKPGVLQSQRACQTLAKVVYRPK